MRFLGIGQTCDLGALYLRLIEGGHEVRVQASNPFAEGTMAGLVDRTDDWRGELAWIRNAGEDGIIIFENVSEGSGDLQDRLRLQGFNVIGGSAFGDRLEHDRAFAQRLLAEAGLPIAGVWEFSRKADALAFLDELPGRYVLKFSGPDATGATYVSRLSTSADLSALLRVTPHTDNNVRFFLMEHVDGIEMGVGAYFNGDKFLAPACLDWEHKRFFPGDLGELTGEMGTVVTYERSRRFFERTLAPLEGRLRSGGHCGYVNLNTIVNAKGIWPLEFTCRFGYPGFAVLEPLQETPWAELFGSMTRKDRPRFDTRPGFAVGIVLTTPPFPYSRRDIDEPIGLPVVFDGPLTEEDRLNLHYCEMGLSKGELVTAGLYGWTMVVTGTGMELLAAQQRANRLADRIIIPNGRYRRDIGAKLLQGDYIQLEQWGVFSGGD